MLCFLASDSILFRKDSTGFVNAVRHVIPYKMRVVVAPAIKCVSGVIVCSFSPINGYSCRKCVSLLKIRAEVASVKCVRAMKVRELKIQTVIPFFDKGIPLFSDKNHSVS